MHTQNDRFQYLVQQYLRDQCTTEELSEFWHQVQQLKEERAWQPLLDAHWQQSAIGKEEPQAGWTSILQQVYSKADTVVKQPVIPFWRRRVFQWPAAAVLVLSLGITAYFILNSKLNKAVPIVATTPVQDVPAPQHNRATLQLANGQMVYLDSAGNGLLATLAHVQIEKLADGQIAYKGVSNELIMNTLTNPKGSKVINITLGDGSRIWLNAGSSITYPVAFVGKERTVEINGEVYFEVAHNTAQPFRVRHNETEVKVLGTHFNVNAYDDEPNVKVTLLEGAVQARNKAGWVNVKPGEQATLTTNQIPHTSGNVNLEQVMAWKNGLFSFTGADLTTVMRQLSRWYDIQVKYEGQIPARQFSGEITHDLTLSQLMNGLQSLGIQFRIEGRTMIVQQR